MKKKFFNGVNIEGYLYEHDLQKKIAGENAKNPGVEYINGTISIATDEDMLNIVEVYYGYVKELTYKGKVNPTYKALSDIIDGKIGSVMEHGKENASKLKVDSGLGLREFYSTTGDHELVSIKRNESGFIHIIQNFTSQPKVEFEVDFLMTGARHIEPDEERQQPEKVEIKGCIFNDFFKTILPMSFTVLNPRAMAYFENLGASNSTPVFTKIRGNEISKVVVRTITEESAFGEPIVKEVRNTQKDFIVNWAQAVPYEWDNENTLLASELSEMIAARELYLAELKKNQEEYQASQASAVKSAPAQNNSQLFANPGDYNF